MQRTSGFLVLRQRGAPPPSPPPCRGSPPPPGHGDSQPLPTQRPPRRCRAIYRAASAWIPQRKSKQRRPRVAAATLHQVMIHPASQPANQPFPCAQPGDSSRRRPDVKQPQLQDVTKTKLRGPHHDHQPDRHEKPPRPARSRRTHAPPLPPPHPPLTRHHHQPSQTQACSAAREPPP